MRFDPLASGLPRNALADWIQLLQPPPRDLQ